MNAFSPAQRRALLTLLAVSAVQIAIGATVLAALTR